MEVGDNFYSLYYIPYGWISKVLIANQWKIV
jgi:hypothetical protein